MMEKFTFGSTGDKVGLDKKTVASMKQSLGLICEKQFYLRLPDKQYLYMILFCLIVKKESLTSNLKKTFNKLQQGYKKTLTNEYLDHNQNRKEFNAPAQLEKISKTLEYYSKMFGQCYQKFNYKLLDHSSSCFKKDQKIILKYFGSRNDDFAEKTDLTDSEQAILLFEEQNNKSLIIATFQGRKQPKEEVNNRPPKEKVNNHPPKEEEIENEEEKEEQQEDQEPPMQIGEDEDNEDGLQPQEDRKENIIFGVFLALVLIIVLILLRPTSTVSNSLDGFLVEYFPNCTIFVGLWETISSY